VPAYNKNGISLIFEATKPPGHPQFSTLNAVTTNANPFPVPNLAIQAAVPKYLKIQMNPASGAGLAQNGGKVTQIIRVINSEQGKKPVILRVKLDYVLNGNPITEMVDVAFPPTM